MICLFLYLHILAIVHHGGFSKSSTDSFMAKNTEDETPNEKWNNWALLKAYEEPAHEAIRPQIAGWIAARFKASLDDLAPGPRSFLVITSCGHWGRGTNLAEAALAAKKSGGRRPSKAVVTLVLNDGTAQLNNYGSVLADSVATILHIGAVGTLGGLLNANK